MNCIFKFNIINWFEFMLRWNHLKKCDVICLFESNMTIPIKRIPLTDINIWFFIGLVELKCFFNVNKIYNRMRGFNLIRQIRFRYVDSNLESIQMNYQFFFDSWHEIWSIDGTDDINHGITIYRFERMKYSFDLCIYIYLHIRWSPTARINFHQILSKQKGFGEHFLILNLL